MLQQAIHADLNILDTVIAKEVGYHDVAEEILTEYPPWMDSSFFTVDAGLLSGLIESNAHDPSVVVGRMATGEKFIDNHGREDIIASCNPLCVDMETASIVHVCYINRIPFSTIRTISDTPKESGNEVFEKNCQYAGKKSVIVLRRYLDSIFNH
ncbi:5'-methylthioadenosine/S-adenosylhomocysteine nucleosidase [Citrobacter farmeri]|uniref:5'-methylthioadenosine/S-adenosylhomocysteine nucleosidase n=1 Tax=Citrobacter farmeri TaxID=67824 RepID=UPI0021ACF40D|nr:5'-methylthioadenosine/S-adenosylhomocysteine nucleosidase [Citrobacter farmeri]